MLKLVSGGFALALVAAPVSAETLPLVAGTVRMIDKANHNLAIEHDAIPNLQVGNSTMVFRVGRSELFHNVKVGEKVRFTATRMDGRATVVSLLAEEAMLDGGSCE